MTWSEPLRQMVREEFKSAQRRGRGVFDSVEDEPAPIAVRVDTVRTKRRIVGRRVEA